MTDPVDLVSRSLDEATIQPFETRVADQAAFLREAIRSGSLDNDDFAIGLELEVYAIDDEGSLAEIPESVFDACNKELGRHNAELNTDPDPFTTAGIEAQAEALRERWDRAQQAAADAGCELVPDAMWTVPPVEGSQRYFSETEDRTGVTVPTNMRPAPRYWAIDRDAVRHAGGSVPFDVPGASLSFPSILFESLATSIQPHLQIPTAEQFPAYYNTAIRTLGPVLALGTNSPFLPGDLYDAEADPATVVEETHHELRIAAFEQSVNQTETPKVAVPTDVEKTTEVVDNVVADDLYAPFLSEWLDEGGADGSFTDRIWEYDHKRGTYWRWLRCVIGGDPVDGTSDERSLRIEYRPIPTQPTVRDVVGFQVLVGGLLRGLVSADHPLPELPWADAEACFYDVVEHGLVDADLAWVTADGERTDDPTVVYDEVFTYARRGLAAQGIDEAVADRYLAPLEARWEARTAPSSWKQERVREELADGADLATALERMQERYVHLAREHETFADWL